MQIDRSQIIFERVVVVIFVAAAAELCCVVRVEDSCSTHDQGEKVETGRERERERERERREERESEIK